MNPVVHIIRWTLVAAALCLVPCLPAAAAVLPAGFSESLIAGGLQDPTAMALAPDGRLFVCEQAGRLRVIKNGALLPTPFATVTVNATGERGLLGVAFDPEFQLNGFVYVYYTATTPVIHNRVSRFTAAGDVAVPLSERSILDLEPLGAINHNGGAIHFGNDGKLYVGVGENGVPDNAKTLSNRLGKILRINSDGTIPDDNPFYTTALGDNRSIWALGLRNPFTFAFEPLSGNLFINDVGERTWEEINQGVRGANYGWPTTEGPTSNPAFRAPLYSYSHGTGCAISGGAFHNLSKPQFPIQYWGAYFFADLCGGWIAFRAGNGTVTTFATGISLPVDLTTHPDGSLYYLARGAGGGASGVVYRIAYTAGAPKVDLTANGGDGPLQLSAGQSLEIALSFDAGSAGIVSPAELYIGLASPFGVFWLDQATGTLVTHVERAFAGPLTDLGPATLGTVPDVSVLPPGPYLWFTIVDNDSNGVPAGRYSDFVLVNIR